MVMEYHETVYNLNNEHQISLDVKQNVWHIGDLDDAAMSSLSLVAS